MWHSISAESTECCKRLWSKLPIVNLLPGTLILTVWFIVRVSAITCRVWVESDLLVHSWGNVSLSIATPPPPPPSLHIELGQRTFRSRRLGMRTITPRILKILQVRANRMCTRISFYVSKKVREIRAFFLFMTKIQLKRVNLKLSWWTIDMPSTGRFRETSSGPEKNLVQHGLVDKMANFVDSRKLLLRGYKFKETEHDKFGKRPAATRGWGDRW